MLVGAFGRGVAGDQHLTKLRNTGFIFGDQETDFLVIAVIDRGSGFAGYLHTGRYSFPTLCEGTGRKGGGKGYI